MKKNYSLKYTRSIIYILVELSTASHLRKLFTLRNTIIEGVIHVRHLCKSKQHIRKATSNWYLWVTD